MESIKDNYLKIKDKIDFACRRVGRSTEDVHLVVVTKRQPIEKIIAVCEAGAQDLGDNYPEEVDRNIDQLGNLDTVTWHMIGHIQSRKIRFVVQHFSIVHSIDRFEIALKLNQACAQAGKKLSIFAEVNLAGEDNKNGFRYSEDEDFDLFSRQISAIAKLENLDLVGLMTMPPLVNHPSENRNIFKDLRTLLIRLHEVQKLPHFSSLSMGTSQDYEIAIEEGATHIRIGEAIMGKRIYAQ